MEVVLLSFLAQVVQTEFGVGTIEASLTTSIVFIGAFVGTLTLGPLGDKIGRKPMFLTAASVIAGSGFASAASPNYWTLVFFRFGVGIGLGGIVIPYDAMAEFMPATERGM